MDKQEDVPLNEHPLHSQETTQWTLKLKTAIAAAESSHLKGCTLKIKELCVNMN